MDTLFLCSPVLIQALLMIEETELCSTLLLDPFVWEEIIDIKLLILELKILTRRMHLGDGAGADQAAPLSVASGTESVGCAYLFPFCLYSGVLSVAFVFV